MFDVNIYLKNNSFNIVQIIVTTIIAFIIALVVYIKYNKEEFDKDFEKNKCNPLFWLYAPFSKNYKGKNALSAINLNFKECLFKMLKNIFDILTKPFHFMFQIVYKIIDSIKNTLNSFRKFIFKMRTMMKKYIENLMDRLQNTLGSVVYVFAKTKDILDKMQASFISGQFLLWSIFNMVSYVSNIVVQVLIDFLWMCIGILAGILFLVFFWATPLVVYLSIMLGISANICFDKDTKFKLANGEIVKISEIRNNDVLEKGGKVLGVMKFLRMGEIMFNFNNTIVSGNHLVYENNNWVRIQKSVAARPIYDYNEKYIYCLHTEDNLMSTNNTLFRDYRETENPETNSKIDDIIIDNLNSNVDDNINSNVYSNVTKLINQTHHYPKAFYNNTIISMFNNKQKQIDEIEIGDILKYGERVTGIVKLRNDNIKLYSYFYNVPEIIVSGSQIVFEDGKWIKVCQSQYSSSIDNSSSKYLNKQYDLYNICTTNNIIVINGIKFRDFDEINDYKINNDINRVIEDELNKKQKNNELAY